MCGYSDGPHPPQSSYHYCSRIPPQYRQHFQLEVSNLDGFRDIVPVRRLSDRLTVVFASGARRSPRFCIACDSNDTCLAATSTNTDQMETPLLYSVRLAATHLVSTVSNNDASSPRL